MQSARDLFLHELANLRDAEQKLVDLREQAGNAVSLSLRRAFASHLAQAQQQGERLQQAYTHLDEQSKAMHCINLKDLLEGLGKFKSEEDPSADTIAMLVLHSTWRAMSR